MHIGSTSQKYSGGRMHHLGFSCIAAVTAASAATPPALDWASQPISPNETVLLLGGPFTATSVVLLTTTPTSRPSLGAGETATAVPVLQPSSGSVKFVVPANLSQAQWDVVVDGSAPYTLNGPQPWWIGGDLRQVATPGGYMRVFGSCVHFERGDVAGAQQRVSAASASLAAAFDRGEGMSSLMARVQEMDDANRALKAANDASSSILRLRGATGTASASLPTVLIKSDAENSTGWSAWFPVPASVAPGTYTVEVANQLNPDNFVALGRFGSYQSPLQPNVTTIDVIGTGGLRTGTLRAAAAASAAADVNDAAADADVDNAWGAAETVATRHPWKAKDSKIFDVTDYGPFGLPGCGGPYNKNACPVENATGKPILTSMYWANASVAIEKALAAAGEAGGGTVYFPRGTYFINSTFGFDVPWNVKLEGEGKELVELIFTETYSVCALPSCTAKPFSALSGALAYFRGPTTGTGGWASDDPPPNHFVIRSLENTAEAVSDLTVYFTAFHNDIFYVSSNTTGFEMQRVRVTANSFLGGNGPNKGRSAQANVSWGLQDTGAVIIILANDYLIEDCDLYGDGDVIRSNTGPEYCTVQHGSSFGPAHCHGSAWGIIRSNRLFNGGTSHFMPQWKQMIFENNTVVGTSPISGGQSVGTGPGGGRAQHIYHARNTIQFVWGNDREIVTFDDAGSAYLGEVADVSADGLVLTLADDARSSFSGEWKGWDGAAVTVLNGTGVGTWRRVVVSGIDASDNPGEFHNPHNRTWKIDRPFGFAVTAGQAISITPARSRIIFEGDHYMDGGTLQFYGQAQECVVQSLVGERVAGMVAWGQWRGWYTPPCGTMGMPPCSSAPSAPPHSSSRSRHGTDDTDGKATRLGGEMGNGIMMNSQLSYLDNKILEGNTIVRWSAMGGGSYLPGFDKFYNACGVLMTSHTTYSIYKGAKFSIQGVTITPNPGGNCKNEKGDICHDWSKLTATTAVIYRRNTALSNGGFQVNGGQFTTSIRDVIIEGNTVLKSDPEKAMQIAKEMHDPSNGTCIVRANILPTGTSLE